MHAACSQVMLVQSLRSPNPIQPAVSGSIAERVMVASPAAPSTAYSMLNMPEMSSRLCMGRAWGRECNARGVSQAQPLSVAQCATAQQQAACYCCMLPLCRQPLCMMEHLHACIRHAATPACMHPSCTMRRSHAAATHMHVRRGAHHATRTQSVELMQHQQPRTSSWQQVQRPLLQGVLPAWGLWPLQQGRPCQQLLRRAGPRAQSQLTPPHTTS